MQTKKYMAIKYRLISILILYISVLFTVVDPVFAQTGVLDGNLVIGEETIDGYRQVYYLSGNKKIFITQGQTNSRMPHTSGDYITYISEINGEGQIFLHHVPSSTTLKLTNHSTNLEPKVNNDGWVVWEGWIPEEDGWQVFLFDMVSVRQLTSGDLSMNPDIEDKYVIYSRKSVAEEWKAVIYSANEDKHIDVTFGEKTRVPKIKNGKIYLLQGTEEYTLMVGDLFLLDFKSLTTPKEVTIEEIEREILENAVFQ